MASHLLLGATQKACLCLRELSPLQGSSATPTPLASMVRGASSLHKLQHAQWPLITHVKLSGKSAGNLGGLNFQNSRRKTLPDEEKKRNPTKDDDRLQGHHCRVMEDPKKVKGGLFTNFPSEEGT